MSVEYQAVMPLDEYKEMKNQLDILNESKLDGNNLVFISKFDSNYLFNKNEPFAKYEILTDSELGKKMNVELERRTQEIMKYRGEWIQIKSENDKLKDEIIQLKKIVATLHYIDEPSQKSKPKIKWYNKLFN